MKLNEILVEAADKDVVAERIFKPLLRYLEYNARDPQVVSAWQLAMSHFPEHVYRGKMFRGLIFNEQDHPVAQAIEAGDRKTIMQLVRSHSQIMNSFTTDLKVAQDWAAPKPWNKTPRGSIVIEQDAVGLKIGDLLADIYMKKNGRQIEFDFDDDYGIETEVIASTSPNCIIREITPRS